MQEIDNNSQVILAMHKSINFYYHSLVIKKVCSSKATENYCTSKY